MTVALTARVPVAEASTATASASERLHLPVLDGLRGVAALYVVAVHACYGAFPEPPRGFWRAFEAVFSQGKAAVGVFIVLSGFCLMLPVLSRTSATGLRGWLRYVQQRAYRILPPYFAALAVSLAMLWALPVSVTRGGWAGSFWPAFETDVVLSHLLLVHNFSNDWISRINPPFWSVATEWQIYFLFPLFLLPLMRRLGPVAAVVGGLFAGLGLIFVFRRFETAAPWFLGLFAMGMAIAGFALGNTEAHARWRRLLGSGPVVFLGLVAYAVAAVLLHLAEVSSWKGTFVLTSVAGVAFSSLLLWLLGPGRLTTASVPCRRGVAAVLQRGLTAPAVLFLGRMSYSLYLIHAMALMVSAWGVGRMGLPDAVHAPVHLLVGVVGSVAVGWVFHRLFEKPLLDRKRRKARGGAATPASPTHPAVPVRTVSA